MDQMPWMDLGIRIIKKWYKQDILKFEMHELHIWGREIIFSKVFKEILKSVSYGKLHNCISSISYEISTTKFCRLNIWLSGRNKSNCKKKIFMHYICESTLVCAG